MRIERNRRIKKCRNYNRLISNNYHEASRLWLLHDSLIDELHDMCNGIIEMRSVLSNLNLGVDKSRDFSKMNNMIKLLNNYLSKVNKLNNDILVKSLLEHNNLSLIEYYEINKNEYLKLLPEIDTKGMLQELTEFSMDIEVYQMYLQNDRVNKIKNLISNFEYV